MLGLLEFWSGQPGTAVAEQIFTIKSGENALVVATNLDDAGIVRNRFGFLYALARLKKLEGGMIAGEYRLSPTLSSREIALRITTGQVLSRIFALPFRKDLLLSRWRID